MFYENVLDASAWLENNASDFTYDPKMKEAASKREFELGNVSALYNIIMIRGVITFP